VKQLLLLVAAAIPLLVGSAAPSSAFSADQPQLHQNFRVDDKRFLDSFVSLTKTGAIHVHLKVSNGWRVNPMHVRANLIFYDATNREIFRLSGHVWCKASGGGGGKENDYDFDVPRSDVWYSAEKVALVGSYERPPPPRNTLSAPSLTVFTF
jgi:hypothetical protein